MKLFNRKLGTTKSMRVRMGTALRVCSNAMNLVPVLSSTRAMLLEDLFSTYMCSKGITVNSVRICATSQQVSLEKEHQKKFHTSATIISPEHIKEQAEHVFSITQRHTELISDNVGYYIPMKKTSTSYLELVSREEEKSIEWLRGQQLSGDESYGMRLGYENIPLWINGLPSRALNTTVACKVLMDKGVDVMIDPLDYILPYSEDTNALMRKLSVPQPLQWIHVGDVNGGSYSEIAGYTGEVTRTYMYSTHYRRDIKFRDTEYKHAHALVCDMYRVLLRANAVDPNFIVPSNGSKYHRAMCAALDYDLNTPSLIYLLYDAIQELDKAVKRGTNTKLIYGEVMRMASVLKIAWEPPEKFFSKQHIPLEDLKPLVPEYNDAVIKHNTPLCKLLERRVAYSGGEFKRNGDIYVMVQSEGKKTDYWSGC